jgi:hypothetical protein
VDARNITSNQRVAGSIPARRASYLRVSMSQGVLYTGKHTG